MILRRLASPLPLLLALPIVLSLTGCSSLKSISILPAAGSTVLTAVGQTVQFTAFGSSQMGSGQSTTSNLTNSVTWASSNPSVASINSSGLATAVGAGYTEITAQSGGVIATSDLSVTISSGGGITGTPSIIVSPSSTTETFVGETTQLTATGNLTGVGGVQNLTTQVQWASSNMQVATVNYGTVRRTDRHCDPDRRVGCNEPGNADPHHHSGLGDGHRRRSDNAVRCNWESHRERTGSESDQPRHLGLKRRTGCDNHPDWTGYIGLRPSVRNQLLANHHCDRNDDQRFGDYSIRQRNGLVVDNHGANSANGNLIDLRARVWDWQRLDVERHGAVPQLRRRWWDSLRPDLPAGYDRNPDGHTIAVVKVCRMDVKLHGSDGQFMHDFDDDQPDRRCHLHPITLG